MISMSVLITINGMISMSVLTTINGSAIYTARCSFCSFSETTAVRDLH